MKRIHQRIQKDRKVEGKEQERGKNLQVKVKGANCFK